MTREEAKNILGENATEEQITNLLNAYHVNESNKVKDLEAKLNGLQEQSKKYSDYDEIKAKLEEINKASMTEQEKIAKEKEEIAKNLAESRIIKNTAKAKDILAGLNVNDAIISRLVSENEDDTLKSVNELKAMLESQKELVAKETRESLTNVNLDPTLPNVNQNDDAMTFEKFGSMSTEEQEKWIAENPNGLENL